MSNSTLFIVIAAVVLFVRPIRRLILSRPIMFIMKRMNLVPAISDTEKQAIEAGTAWMEREIFSGKPKIKTLMSQPSPMLTPEEKQFLDHQVEELCMMIDDYKLWRERSMPKEVWDFIRREKFLGMIIPREHGGLGFSPYAQSEVIKKLASKSFVIAIYVMVPNSLGPGELILHYGTDEQKNYYLPRLAIGEDVPCFALTETTAGSDAGNLKSRGVVFKRNNELYIRLNWDKRYISLAKISTIMGVAFHLYDPDKLLHSKVSGGKEDLGITCALVPSNAPGVILEHRHDPLGVPFYNCPTHGRDVEIPISAVVGGLNGVGKGWKMLMECLAAGRGISFPAQMAGSSQLVARFTSAYAQVREQFGVAIGKFEGIQKPLARVVSYTYLIEALRTYTASALNQGKKSAVAASISKYYSTEYSRKVVNDSMDILGGSAISMGPRNKIAPYYIAQPMGITVEGANILTRNLMIFGQGAFRAHPHAFPMIDGLQRNDLEQFDRAIFGLGWHATESLIRSVLFSLTRGWLALPFSSKKQARYFRKISWASATFAFYTDLSMGALGGKLKFKESITARFADVLGYLYIAAAILKKYETDGESKEEWPIVEHTLDHVFHEIEIAFQEIFSNFPHPVLGVLLKPVLLWSRINPISSGVKDKTIEYMFKQLHTVRGSALMEKLTQGIFIPKDPKDHLIQVENAAEMAHLIEPIIKKQKKAPDTLTHEDKAQIALWRTMQSEAVRVDEFTEEEYHGAGYAVKATLSAFAHDLKGSLTTMKLAAQQTQKKLGDRAIQEPAIEKIVTAVDKANELIQGLISKS